MKQNTKDFLLELGTVLKKYNVVIEITESFKVGSDFTAEGIDLTASYYPDTNSFPIIETVSLQGTYFDAYDILDLVENSADD